MDIVNKIAKIEAENKRLQDESLMLQRAIIMIRMATKDPKVDKIAYDAEVSLKGMNDEL